MDSCPPTAADWANSTAQSAKQQGERLQGKVESLEKRVEELERIIRRMGEAFGVSTEEDETDTVWRRRRLMIQEAELTKAQAKHRGVLR